jgi:hypothetical protein
LVLLILDLGKIARDVEQHALARRGGTGRFLVQPLIEIPDRRVQRAGDIIKPASRNAVDTALIFGHLLIRDADHPGELPLGQPEHDAALADARSDVGVDHRGGRSLVQLFHAAHLIVVSTVRDGLYSRPRSNLRRVLPIADLERVEKLRVEPWHEYWGRRSQTRPMA